MVAMIAMGGGCASTPSAAPEGPRVRVLTYYLGGVGTDELQRSDHGRLKRAAAQIQALSPDILFISGLAYDQTGQNARRFVTNYLSRPQADTLSGRSYRTVMLPVNTGDARGAERIPVRTVHAASVSVAPSSDAISTVRQALPAPPTDSVSEGMALFVHPDHTVLRDSIRTFRRFLWAEMPGAARPRDRHSGAPWHPDETWQTLRLSSRSHWDVPVRIAEGTVLHVLASHPAVPTRDGAAQRSDRRNHDEIRFWVDYLNDAAYIEDDSSHGGGLEEGAAFVLVGRLNADPDDDNVFRAAVRELISHDRVRDITPKASGAGRSTFSTLTAEATARWGGRVDYVLPSRGLTIDTSGISRPVSDTAAVRVSDHFPVWVDLRLPGGGS